jgi:AcrR family transcriptional regulator
MTTKRGPIEEKRTPRRERERLLRRNDIIQAARHLFAERGYREATLEEIAVYAEFGKGTIYNYFKSKEHLFQAILDETFDEIIHLTKHSIEQGLNARERLKSFAVEGMKYYKENRDFFILLIREASQVRVEARTKNINKVLSRLDEVLSIIASVIKQDMKSGKIKDVDTIAVSNIFLNMVHGFLMRNITELKHTTDEKINDAANLIVSIFFDGISAGG